MNEWMDGQMERMDRKRDKWMDGWKMGKRMVTYTDAEWTGVCKSVKDV